MAKKYKKTKTEKIKKIDGFTLVRETWEESPDGEVEIRYTKPIKIKLKGKKK